jgi:hypothetical protein
VDTKSSQKIIGEYHRRKERLHQFFESIFPGMTVCFGMSAMHAMHNKMCHFVHVGDQEKVWMQVCVYCDLWRLSRATDEVTDFRLPALSKSEEKGIADPQIEAVGPSCFGHMRLKSGSELVRSHKIKKALDVI